ncbi:F-box containing protein [Tunisvirus fontaine2]|uniref:F-box containing protein n=1 Tax=Tunisvirus fontaine2 TaxID=1421067 RepID=V9SGU0_9VIRU|nr:F-box containing protein [Tunisvirus fontaine2]AHC54992.1 F-box containing protein [Tunisvirus fontaine2]
MEFQDFSNEVVLHIVSFLEKPKDINSFGQTCSLHLSLVRRDDMRLARKVYGVVPTSGGVRGWFSVTPTGVLHGSCCAFHNESVTAVEFVNGEKVGFEMTAFNNGDIRTGSYRQGQRFGLWRMDSAGFREDWDGKALREFYDERGCVYAHSKDENLRELIVQETLDPDIIIYYEEKMMVNDEMYCDKTNFVFTSGLVKHIYNKKTGETTSTGAMHWHCCEYHQREMPEDLLYFEEESD